jgi:hypothetical protein
MNIMFRLGVVLLVTNVAAVTLITRQDVTTPCAAYCGFNCVGYRMVEDDRIHCEIYSHIDYIPVGVIRNAHYGDYICWSLLKECVMCPGKELDWWSIQDSGTTTIVSANCGGPVAGVVHVETGNIVIDSQSSITSALTQDSRLSTIAGPCPLLRVGDGGSVHNIILRCTSGNRAIVLTGGKAHISNVHVTSSQPVVAIFGQRLLSSPRRESLDISNTVIEHITVDAPPPHRLLVIGHVVGRDSTVTCTVGQVVVVQPRESPTPTGIEIGNLCKVWNVTAYTGVLGRRYNTMFYHPDAFVDNLSAVLHTIIIYLGLYTGIALSSLGIIHQDYFFLRTMSTPKKEN